MDHHSTIDINLKKLKNDEINIKGSTNIRCLLKLYEITIDSTSKYNGWNISLHFPKIKN